MKRGILWFGLLLGVFVANAAVAQTHLGLRGIGGAVSYVNPENTDGLLGLGIFADFGNLTPRIRMETRLDYWSNTETSFVGRASISDVTLGARGKYMIEVRDPKFQPYVGAGLGLHFLHVELTTPAGGGFPAMTADDSQTKLGLDLGGGVMTPIAPQLTLMGEMWFGFVSDVDQFSLRFGLCRQL